MDGQQTHRQRTDRKTMDKRNDLRKDRWREGWRDWETYTNGQTDGWTNWQDRQMDRNMERRMDRGMEREREMGWQMDRQTTDILTDGQKDRQTGREMDEQTYRQTDRWTDWQMDRYTDWRTHRQRERQADGLTDRQKEGQSVRPPVSLPFSFSHPIILSLSLWPSSLCLSPRPSICLCMSLSVCPRVCQCMFVHSFLQQPLALSGPCSAAGGGGCRPCTPAARSYLLPGLVPKLRWPHVPQWLTAVGTAQHRSSRLLFSNLSTSLYLVDLQKSFTWGVQKYEIGFDSS